MSAFCTFIVSAQIHKPSLMLELPALQFASLLPFMLCAHIHKPSLMPDLPDHVGADRFANAAASLVSCLASFFVCNSLAAVPLQFVTLFMPHSGIVSSLGMICFAK